MVVFDTQEALIDAAEEVKVGTLAFVVSDQMLYIRSAPGWRSITVRHLKKRIEETMPLNLLFCFEHSALIISCTNIMKPTSMDKKCLRYFY